MHEMGQNIATSIQVCKVNGPNTPHLTPQLPPSSVSLSRDSFTASPTDIVVNPPISTSSFFWRSLEPTTFGLILKKSSLTRKCQSGGFWRSTSSVNLFSQNFN